MPNPAKVRLYVVMRYDWDYNDEFYYRSSDGEGLKAFRNRSQAEAYRMEQERQARDGVNPFEMNELTLDAVTSLSGQELVSRLRAAGIEAPAIPEDDDGLCELMEWWVTAEDELTDVQKDLVWDLLDKARFFEVVEMEMEVET